MLGTVADTEEKVQATFRRWQQTAQATVKSVKIYLVTIITVSALIICVQPACNENSRWVRVATDRL
ncbi:hypothetical protein BV378_28155 [Nostoc sp. RF31YmG]|nr:hypothetical protein BV378_28155 [Nostoc sp. RF31YmG]